MHLTVHAELQHINLSSCSILILNFLVEHNEIQGGRSNQLSVCPCMFKINIKAKDTQI
jgi:hypothetical protein